MQGKLGLKNLTNWNNLFMSLLGSIGASLLAFSMIQMSSAGAFGAIGLGLLFIVVGAFLSLTQSEECFVRTENLSDKVKEFVCYNRKVVLLLLTITGSPLIAIGGASLLSADHWLYTMLAGFALLALAGLFILKVPENLDGRFRRQGMKQVKTPTKECPDCGAQAPKMSKFCPDCGGQMGGGRRSFGRAEAPTEAFDEEPSMVPYDDPSWDEQQGSMPPHFEE